METRVQRLDELDTKVKLHLSVFSVMRDVYSMLGEDSFGQTKKMFEMMDKDRDNKITEREFIRASLEDPELTRMLSCRN